MRRTLRPLAALAMIAAVVAGCGNGSAGTGSGGNSTAAAPAGSGSSAASHNSTATTREKAVKFAECMRANGVSAFPVARSSPESVERRPFGFEASPANLAKPARFAKPRTAGREAVSRGWTERCAAEDCDGEL